MPGINHNIAVRDVRRWLKRAGFSGRMGKGTHEVWEHRGGERVVLSWKGNQAAPKAVYHVRQAVSRITGIDPLTGSSGPPSLDEPLTDEGGQLDVVSGSIWPPDADIEYLGGQKMLPTSLVGRLMLVNGPPWVAVPRGHQGAPLRVDRWDLQPQAKVMALHPRPPVTEPPPVKELQPPPVKELQPPNGTGHVVEPPKLAAEVPAVEVPAVGRKPEPMQVDIDEKVRELFNQGHGRPVIAQKLGLSEWGVRLQLKRLGLQRAPKRLEPQRAKPQPPPKRMVGVVGVKSNSGSSLDGTNATIEEIILSILRTRGMSTVDQVFGEVARYFEERGYVPTTRGYVQSAILSLRHRGFVCRGGWEKAEGGRSFPTFARTGKPWVMERVHRTELEGQEVKAQILDYVKDHPNCKGSAVQAALNLTPGAWQTYRQALVDAKELTQIGRRSVARYRLPTQPADQAQPAGESMLDKDVVVDPLAFARERETRLVAWLGQRPQGALFRAIKEAFSDANTETVRRALIRLVAGGQVVRTLEMPEATDPKVGGYRYWTTEHRAAFEAQQQKGKKLMGIDDRAPSARLKAGGPSVRPAPETSQVKTPAPSNTHEAVLTALRLDGPMSGFTLYSSLQEEGAVGRREDFARTLQAMAAEGVVCQTTNRDGQTVWDIIKPGSPKLGEQEVEEALPPTKVKTPPKTLPRGEMADELSDARKLFDTPTLRLILGRAPTDEEIRQAVFRAGLEALSRKA